MSATCATPDSGSGSAAVISVRELTKRYGELVAVDGVSFEVARGEVFGILGPNGAGKTTTLEMIEGLTHPDGGEVVVDGLSVWPDPNPVKSRIGVQLQATALFDRLRLGEIIKLFGSCYGLHRTDAEADALLDRVGLLDKRASYADQLSGGQAQRLSIALALVNDPVVTFLDEPTTGLDPRARRALWDVIRAIKHAGTTVVITTHYMEEAERLCDRVAVMDRGLVMALDTPRALVRGLGADAHVTFTLDRPAPLGLLCGLAGVSSCSARDGEGYSMVTRNAQRAVTSLLDFAAAEGYTIENLDVKGASLEDVFLQMTGHALTDDEDEGGGETVVKPRRRWLFGRGR